MKTDFELSQMEIFRNKQKSTFHQVVQKVEQNNLTILDYKHVSTTYTTKNKNTIYSRKHLSVLL